MIVIADYLFFITIPISFYAFFSFIFSIKDKKLINGAVITVYFLCILFILVLLAICYALIINDFSFKIITDISSRDLPVLYRITSFVVNQKGFFLFYTFLLLIFTAFTVRKTLILNDSTLNPFVPAVLFVFLIIFLIFLNFFESPFDKLIFVPEDGKGLILGFQNFWLTSYLFFECISFTGFTIAFGYAISVLLNDPKDINSISNLIFNLKRWYLSAWGILSFALMLEIGWAQTRAGWRGYAFLYYLKSFSTLIWLLGVGYVFILYKKRRVKFNLLDIILPVITFLLIFVNLRFNLIHNTSEKGYGPLNFFLLLLIAGIICFSSLIIFLKYKNIKILNLGIPPSTIAGSGYSLISFGLFAILISIFMARFDYNDYLLLRNGESALIRGYTVFYNGMSFNSGKDKFTTKADFTLKEVEGSVIKLIPEKEIYRDLTNKYRKRISSKVAIYSSFSKFIFLSLRKYDDDRNVFIKISLRHLVSLLWVGGILLLGGVTIAVRGLTQDMKILS